MDTDHAGQLVSSGNVEADIKRLDAPVTPRGDHFVRRNFDVPDLSVSSWRLTVGGAILRPRVLDFDTLTALPIRREVVTLECAGNGRLGQRPLPPGEPWGVGAVSTAWWTGVPLNALLRESGIRDDVIEVLAASADGGFARSLPIGKALSDEVLLAVAMNDGPVPPEHGGPVRLIVPGWYGMASVKWVERIELLTEPFEGRFQTERYVFVDDAGRTLGPVGRVRVRALMTSLTEGQVVPRGPAVIGGWAWSGEGEVVSVEVSVGGQPWESAELKAPLGPWAWRRWALKTRFEEAGRQVIRVRATDSAGHQQLEVPVWNALGYANNAVWPVTIQVS